MLSLKSSDEIAYNGSNNCARMDLFADTASDLTGVTTFDSIVLLAGSSALDISTGDLYRMQSDGTWILQPGTGAFSNVYTKAEIDAMLANYYTKTEADDLFEWVTYTITTDTLPLQFISDGSPLTALSISGNRQQTGTPTPIAPITPDFVGTFDGADWTIPITCAEQTVTVNLGAVQTVRKIRKLVLDGTETVYDYTNADIAFRINTTDALRSYRYCICSHFPYQYSPGQSTIDGVTAGAGDRNLYFTFSVSSATAAGIMAGDTNSFQSYLADQYANGTPVIVWYVIETQTIGINNEPLSKIGEYADELNSTTPIPTVNGSNTLTVETDLQPSEMTITGKIRET